MARGTLTVKLVGDHKDLDRSLKGGMGSLAKWGTAAVAAGVVAAAAIVKVGPALYKTGVQLATIKQKSATVFEGMAGDVGKWADSVNEGFGLTDDQVVGLAANFGDLLKPMGFTSKEAANMSMKVVGLSGALSSWSGGTRTAAEVSEILAKAMLGERDSLKELGISITEADVQTRLATKGQEKLTGAALEQAKALATQELIFEKSTDAQKAWAEGGNKALLAQNNLKAVVGELKEDLATKLLPAMTSVTEGVGLFWTALSTGMTEDEGGTWFENLGLAVHTATDAVGKFWTVLSTGMTQDEGGTWFEDLAFTIRDLVADFKSGEGTIGMWKDTFALFGGPLKIIAVDLLPLLGPLFDTLIEQFAEIVNEVGPPLIEMFVNLAEVVLPSVIAVLQLLTDAIEAHPIIVQTAVGLIVAAWVYHKVQAALHAASVAASWVVTSAGALATKLVYIAATTVIVAQWLAHAVAATLHAAAVAAAWLVTSAGAAPAAVVVVAQTGIMIAKWVAHSTAAMLHAGKIAVAWLIALGPVGLLALAVVAAVVLIIIYWDKLKTATNKVADAFAEDMDRMMGPLDELLGKLAGIKGVTGFLEHVPIPGVQQDLLRDEPRKPKAPVGGGGGSIKYMAAGVRNFAGGWAVVGDDGPELMHLPRGTDVFANGTGPGGPAVVNVILDGKVIASAVIDRTGLADLRSASRAN